jgi:hypothetical protein
LFTSSLSRAGKGNGVFLQVGQHLQVTEALYRDRCISQLLRSFNLRLPTRHHSNDSDETHAALIDNTKRLDVSNLKASTLSKIGGIKLIWTLSLSSHLTFDLARRQLSLFCLPAFCDLNQASSSLLSM